jgi:hypothetical protein
VSQLFLAKELDGDAATFLRSIGEAFIVEVNGVERAISREARLSLPERRSRDRSTDNGRYDLPRKS